MLVFLVGDDGVYKRDVVYDDIVDIWGLGIDGEG